MIRRFMRRLPAKGVVCCQRGAHESAVLVMLPCVVKGRFLLSDCVPRFLIDPEQDRWVVVQAIDMVAPHAPGVCP